MTAYDAVYVALAELLDAPLFTRDRRLAAAVGHLIQVELVWAAPPPPSRTASRSPGTQITALDPQG